MVFEKHIPKPPLDQYVDCIVYVEGNNKGVGFPKTAMSLVFNLSDSFKLYSDSHFNQYIDYKKYWVAGLQTGPSYVENYGLSRMVVIQFRSFGACRFLREPLRQFADSYVDLDCLLHGEAEHTWEQLQEAKTVARKFEVTESFLEKRLARHGSAPHRILPGLTRSLHPGPGNPVQDICRNFNISRKHLNFLFGEYLGVSPKMYLSLERFQKTLVTISRSKPARLTELAYELDYFDQSHFSNNFKRFTGLNPNEYVRRLESNPSLRYMPHFLPYD
jgi:AraC-like DNA-binding protein